MSKTEISKLNIKLLGQSSKKCRLSFLFQKRKVLAGPYFRKPTFIESFLEEEVGLCKFHIILVLKEVGVN